MRDELHQALYAWCGTNVMPRVGMLEGTGPTYDFDCGGKRMIVLVGRDEVLGICQDVDKSRRDVRFESIEQMVEMLEWVTS